MILDMIRKWEEGYRLYLRQGHERGKRSDVLDSQAILRLVKRLSGVETYENYTGFGLYDRKVVEVIKSFDDPYPYFRA